MQWPESREVVTRFAPSPTGLLHLGHAYSALLNQRLARDLGGRFLLRVDDLNTARCRPEFALAMGEDLDWLGLPGVNGSMIQSARRDVYWAAIEELTSRGIVYRSDRGRDDVDVDNIASAPHGPVRGRFEGAALTAMDERDDPVVRGSLVWRLDLDVACAEVGAASERLTWSEYSDSGITQRAIDGECFDGLVLGRSDGVAGYHLACVLDDAAQGVTLVCRGEELGEVAALHTLLCRVLGYSLPIYRHHAMITDASGGRLSKRGQSTSLADLRARGVTAEQIRAWVADPTSIPHPALSEFRGCDRVAAGSRSGRSR